MFIGIEVKYIGYLVLDECNLPVYLALFGLYRVFYVGLFAFLQCSISGSLRFCSANFVLQSIHITLECRQISLLGREFGCN